MADEEQDGDTEFVDYDEDTISRIQAALAEKEKEALEAIKEDICHWLYDVLRPFNIAPQTFWDSLDTGVALCTLATLIQQTAQEVKKNFDFFVPMETLKCNHRAEPGTFFARDNASNFIDWCRKLGVEEAVIFESEGLVSHKDEKRVILCLLDVARFAEKVGMTAPQLIKMEREIEELEKAEKEDTHFKMTEDKHKSLSPSPVKMNPPPFSRDTCTQQEKDKKNQVSEQQEKAIPRPSRIPRRITRSTVKGVHSQLVSPTAKHTPRVPRKRARERESDCSELQTTRTKRLKTSLRGEGEGEVTSERKKETMDEKVKLYPLSLTTMYISLVDQTLYARGKESDQVESCSNRSTISVDLF